LETSSFNWRLVRLLLSEAIERILCRESSGTVWNQRWSLIGMGRRRCTWVDKRGVLPATTIKDEELGHSQISDHLEIYRSSVSYLGLNWS